MSSAGQILGGAVGAVAGFFVGGPAGAYQGAMLGMSVGGMLDPPKGPTIVGPRLQDTTVQTSTYGAVIPRAYGTVPVVGNVFWLENNRLKEVVTKKKSGGKGGPQTTTKTFSYFATFAVGLCKGPIVGVRRIWVGSKLIYDAGADDYSSIVASNQVSSLFTLHTGADGQLPDARIQSTLGVANTPGYRGLAYLVLKDYPLADHGNSLLAAPVKCEVVCNGFYSTWTVTSSQMPIATQWRGLAWNGRVFVACGESSALAISSDGISWTMLPSPVPSVTWIDIVWTGKIFCMITNVNNKSAVSKDGRTWLVGVMPSSSAWVRLAYNGKEFIAVNGGNSSSVALSSDGATWASSAIGMTQYWNDVAWTGNAWIIVGYNSTSYAKSNESGGWDILSGLYSSGANGWYGAASNGVVTVIFAYGTDKGLYSYDLMTWNQITLGHIGNWTRCTYDAIAGMFLLVGNSQNYLQYSYDGITWSEFNSGPMISLYCPVFDGASWKCTTGAVDRKTIFDIKPVKLNIGQPSLASIVSAEVANSRLLSYSDIDVTALNQPVRGYKVSSVAAIRSAIDPLQAAWPFDVIQSGYKIKFKPRGGSSVATVDALELGAKGSSEDSVSEITVSREMDSILPRRVRLTYLDVGREYDVGEQYAERLNTDAINITSIELALVMSGGEAASNAEMLLYLYWLERNDVIISLPPKFGYLEPGDVITVNSDNAVYSLRLTAINYTQDGRLECSAKYNSSAVYLPTAAGEDGKSQGQGLTLAGDCDYELLDIPLLLDVLDSPGFPVAMTGQLSGWPGGSLYRSDDAGQTWDSLQGFLPPGATMGYAINAIGSGRTALFDNASALNVSLTQGELSSVSESSLLAGANYFAYGVNGRWEIIAAKTCILQGDGSYVLSDMLRGQQGTEWACGLHVAGDRIVALDSSLAFVGVPLNSIGLAKAYRAVTVGKPLDSSPSADFTYAGVNLECLSPVYLNGNRNAANDWALTWIRRTRVGGAWRDNVDAALGEASESYEVDIFSNGAYATVKRTLTGLATAAASYTSAQQVTDFGSNQSTLYVKIYQLSANVGRGFPLITSITR